jgi:cob(I)alamin adenosyltransferase
MPVRKSKLMRNGLVHIYTGEGKGKTTAALGLALRAFGCDCKIYFFQFFKEGLFLCNEAKAIKKLGRNFKFKRFNITHPQFAGALCAKDGLTLRKKLKQALTEVQKVIKSGGFDLIILDEILIGVDQGFVEEEDVLKIIKDKPGAVELVLTGRGATKKLINAADYVTDMKEVKHPFRKGIRARKGIEF